MLNNTVQQNGKMLTELPYSVLRLKKQLSTNFVFCEVQTEPEELIEPQVCYTT